MDSAGGPCAKHRRIIQESYDRGRPVREERDDDDDNNEDEMD